MAVSFDATSQGTSSANSISFSHTCTGTDRILVAYVLGSSSGGAPLAPNSATYNGVAMTRPVSNVTSNIGIAMFYLVNPASGSNTFSASFTSGGGADSMRTILASYTGASQTVQPDSSSSGTSGGASPFDAFTTVVQNTSWVVSGFNNRSGGTQGVSSGTQRGTTISSVFLLADTNAGVSAGLNGVSFTSTSSNGEWLAMSITPEGAAATARSRMLVGMGT